MSSPRAAGLIAVVTAMTSLLVVASPHALAETRSATATPLRATPEASKAAKEPVVDLNGLRREAQKASNELEAATRALVKRQKELEASQRKLRDKLVQLRKAEQELDKVRQPLSDMVHYLYQQPPAAELLPLLSSGDAEILRTLSDVTHMVAERDQVFRDSGQAVQEYERIATEAQELRATSLLQEAQLNVEIETLRDRSQRLVKELTDALRKLGVKLRKNSTGCDPTQISATEEYPNGLLPESHLCPLFQRGHQLRADAAIAFAALNEAYKRRFGKPMCVSSSYRSLAAQQRVYYQRPGLAAVPGRSNHGLGLAVDLCGGVERFRSPEFNWMEANAKKYGFFHPDWAYRSPFEPWHWEYDPKLGAQQ